MPLICFIAGYAAKGIAGSIKDFTSTRSESNIISTPVPVSNSPSQLQDKNSNDTEYWIKLGNSYFDSNQYDDAIAAYLKALELKPENPNVLSDLGVMYRRAGKPDKAISTFDRAYKADPGHPMSLFNKGIVLYYDPGQTEEAIKVWKMLITIDPEFRMPDSGLLTDFLDKLK